MFRTSFDKEEMFKAPKGRRMDHTKLNGRVHSQELLISVLLFMKELFPSSLPAEISVSTEASRLNT